MLASFSIVPVGIGESLSGYVAEVLSIVERSGLGYTVGSMQTTIEGQSDEVMSLVMQCHRRVREMSPRVITTITIDDREGAEGRLTGKIESVNRILRKKSDGE